MTNKEIVLIQEILSSYDIPCWALFTSEKSDPYFEKYINNKTISTSLCVITPYKCFVVSSSLDFDNIEEYQNIVNLKYTLNENSSIWSQLEFIIKKIEFPSKIYLSYSTMGDSFVDILGVGMFNQFKKELKKIYRLSDNSFIIRSAEKIIYALSERKSDSEIEKMRIAAQRANEILEQAFLSIRVDMTEKEVRDLTQSIFEVKPNYFNEFGVIKEEFAWDKEYCPVFICGPNFVKGGHAKPSDTKVQKGFTLYFDFGVTLTFGDGTSFSSDIQRMGYVLNDHEVSAPKEIQNIFDVLYESVSLGIKTIKPGMKGYEIDKVVRGYIQKKGYLDYDHATGHSIGEKAHNPGAILAQKSRSLSNLLIQPNAVYTIEPRIPINNGGSIEEMILVTEKGGLTISPRQESIYLIKNI